MSGDYQQYMKMSEGDYQKYTHSHAHPSIVGTATEDVTPQMMACTFTVQSFAVLPKDNPMPSGCFRTSCLPCWITIRSR